MIHYASSGTSLDVLNAALNNSPISSLENGHWTPLHWACRTGNSSIVERLVDEGFRNESVALSQPGGLWTPVSIALYNGNRKMLEELSPS
jgi:ankyrin repeat protein